MIDLVDRLMHRLTESYRRWLSWSLDRRWLVLISAFVLFVTSLFTFRFLRQEFIPPQDQSRFLVTIYTKMGSSLSFTDSVFKQAEKFYKGRPELESYYVAVGGFGGGLVNQGISFLTLKDPPDRPVVEPFKRRPSQADFMKFVRAEISKIPGVQRVAILDLSLTGFSAQRSYPIEFEVQGPDWKTLSDKANEIREKLKSSGLMADVDTDYNPNMPETEVYPDREKAAQSGVPVATIAGAVSAMVGGLKLLPNKYTDSAGHRDDIQVKLVADQNRTAVDINKIWVRNVFGEIVPFTRVIGSKLGNTLLTITRYNRERAIGIFGNFAPGRSQSEVMDFVQKISKEILPFGYHVTMSGSSQAFTESFKSLFGALILGIFVAYMVLGSQFNSFLHPAIILMALPFSITGAAWAMAVTDTSLNVYSLIGILLLMGIVKKNSILLVEFANHKRGEGLAVREALIEACPIRLRPILMTSIATVAGALPEALAQGAGSEIMRPMAIAVVGGVCVSTFLTLFVVPCAYSLAAPLESHKQEKMLREARELLGELEKTDALALAGSKSHA